MSNITTVALFKQDGKIVYLLMTDDTPHEIMGWENLKDGLNYFTRGYNQAHGRGYESSMSACINYISFNPKLVQFKDLQELVEKLLGSEPPRLMHLRHIAGNYFALKCIPSAIDVYEAGISPDLISPH